MDATGDTSYEVQLKTYLQKGWAFLVPLTSSL